MKLGDVAEEGPDESGFIFNKEVSVNLLAESGRKIVHEGLQYYERHEAVADEAWEVKGELHDLDAITVGSGLDGGHKLLLWEQVEYSFEECQLLITQHSLNLIKFILCKIHQLFTLAINNSKILSIRLYNIHRQVHVFFQSFMTADISHSFYPGHA